MINIGKLYDNFNSAYNTNQLGFFRPVTDFVPAVHEISLDVFNKLVGQANRSQKIKDWLRPFKKTLNIAVESIPSMDYIKEPADYEGYDSGRILIEITDEESKVCCEKGADMLDKGGSVIPWKDIREDFFPTTTTYDSVNVGLIDDNKWGAVLKHVTKYPTLQRPYLRQVNLDGDTPAFEVRPREIGVVVLDYYRKPKEPKYAYTVIESGPDTFLQYQENGSEHLEWSETLVPVFLHRLGLRYGLTIQNQLILQVSKLDKLFE